MFTVYVCSLYSDAIAEEYNAYFYSLVSQVTTSLLWEHTAAE